MNDQDVGVGGGTGVGTKAIERPAAKTIRTTIAVLVSSFLILDLLMPCLYWVLDDILAIVGKTHTIFIGIVSVEAGTEF